MKKSNPIFIIFFCILFTVVTVGSAHALPTPSNISKFNRCLNAKGHTLYDNKGTEGGEKCCYPRNKKTGLKIDDLVNISNYDYDGLITLKRIKALYFSIENKELTKI